MLLCMVFRLYPLSRVSSYYLLTFIFSSFAYFERYLQTFTNSYNYRNMLSILTRRQPCGLLLSIIIHFLPFLFFSCSFSSLILSNSNPVGVFIFCAYILGVWERSKHTKNTHTVESICFCCCTSQRLAFVVLFNLLHPPLDTLFHIHFIFSVLGVYALFVWL